MEKERKYDLSFLNKISNSDENFIKEMIENFKKSSPQIVAKMEKNLNESKYVSMGKQVHKFIPGVSFLGAKKIENDLLKIEASIKSNTKLEEIPVLIENVKKNINELIDQFNKDFNL